MEKTMTPTEVPELETPCEWCEGRGWYTDAQRRVRCSDCGGAGHVPTEFGERVLSLMRHNFRPMLEDAG
ncbi:MAG: hypothetical protein JWO31_2807 [Phycisphaerales bacterium]|nr:hypothetical protein [Phycisphaerales bacterium]